MRNIGELMRNILYAMIVLLMGGQALGQSRITGFVSDEAGRPIAGVSVHLLNTEVTVSSDTSGRFEVRSPGAGRYVIQLSAVGYTTYAGPVEMGAGVHAMQFRLSGSMSQLDAVTVTADKKEELLQQVPVSVTAITARQVEEARLWDIRDITALVPNLSLGNSGDGRNVTSIRGITTTSYDPAVATYIDGVNQFSLDTYIPELSDIERIEVLRGPQGTLFGRNAMGGVINIVTKQPTNVTHGFAEADFGNYGLQRYAGGVRGALVKNVLFAGVSGVFSKRDGYYTNDLTGESFDRQQALNVNYYLKYLPSAGWSVTANMKQQNNQNWGAFPLVNGVQEAFARPFHLDQNAVGKMIDNTLDASLAIRHSGAAIDFTSQSTWQHNYRYYTPGVDGDFSPADAVTIVNDYGHAWNNVSVFTQELRIGSGDSRLRKFNWTAGAYFFSQRVPNKQATHFGADAALVGSPDSNFSTIDITKASNAGVAVYGQLNYTVLTKLELLAGIRYDYEHRDLNVEGEYQPDGRPALLTTADTASALHFSAVSPKLGVKFLVGDHSLLYSTYSRGYRPGGLTQLSADPTQPPLYPYQPEYSNNIEAGIKTNWLAERLRLNFTVFLTHVNNAQVPTLVLPDAITVTRNTGRLVSRGLEGEVSATPVKGLELQYSLGYTDASYHSLRLAENGQTVDLAGKKPIFTPDITSMMSVQYNWKLSARRPWKLIIRGEWDYLGRQYFDLENTIAQSPYSLLHLRAGISTRYIQVFIWGRNIADKKYIQYAYDFGAVHLGDPGTYGITVKTSW
jgi:iron complex outermembrane receptor protein